MLFINLGLTSMVINDFDFITWNILFILIFPFSLGCGITSRKRKSTLTLDLNNEPTETFCYAPSEVDLDSDSISSRLASDTSSGGGKHSSAIYFSLFCA